MIKQITSKIKILVLKYAFLNKGWYISMGGAREHNGGSLDEKVHSIYKVKVYFMCMY